MTEARSVRVSLPASGERVYDVRIGPGVVESGLSEMDAILGGAPGRALVVFDAGLPEADRVKLVAAVRGAGVEPVVTTIEPSERAKSIETLGGLLSAMAAARLDRDDPVIAVGGGIVGDVAGFAAASYRRGVPVIQCPTTLLAMVDASVGGKTGVNLTVTGEGGERLVKNMAGAFWQPAAVLADVSLLGSLSDRVMRSGLAECVKHAMLGGSIDADLGAWMGDRLGSILDRDEGAFTELVARNVAIKAAVVGGDERERAAGGGRALLNLGHTFAHAIEPMAHLSPTGDAGDAPLQHGEAVALGLVAASATAESLGLVAAPFCEAVRLVVGEAGLPTSVAGLPDDAALLDAMLDDKKVSGGALRIVVPDGRGSCRVVASPDRAAVAAGWRAIRSR